MRRAVVGLFFLVACGPSPSTLTLASESSPDETDGGALMQAPLPAPRVDAGADADADAAAPSDGGGSDRSCHCAAIAVRCAGSAGRTYAHADRSACTVDLPMAACALFDLAHGARVDPRDMIATTPRAVMTADEVFDFCAAKHEARHACDEPSVASCATEGSAYGVTVECMLGLRQDLCAADAADCARLSLYIESSRAARDLVDCACDGSGCGACTARCRDEHPDVVTTCERAAALYCAEP